MHTAPVVILRLLRLVCDGSVSNVEAWQNEVRLARIAKYSLTILVNDPGSAATQLCTWHKPVIILVFIDCIEFNVTFT